MHKNNLPRHIAIIMDGNGRWAAKRHLPKIIGHRYGARTVDRITSYCARLGVEVLTLYSFSTENWKRSNEEVSALMNLLHDYLDKKLVKLNKNNIRLNTIGNIEGLPAKVREKLAEVTDKTSKNTGMILTLALNYGAREEIIKACKTLASEVKAENIHLDDINESVFSKHLYTKDLPDPDLLIRTSGELRISNFLLWQISYAEFFVTKVLWPDFKVSDLEKAISEFGQRKRRFGGR